MTKQLKKLFLSLLFFVFITTLQAQSRTCGMVEHMEKQMQNPEYANEYNKSQARFRAQVQQSLNKTSANKMANPIIIPVAVHFPEASESDRSCLEALVQNQIDILNEDYTGTNADISGWNAAAPYYPGVNTGAANILFCIATENHPSGTDNDLVEGRPAITIGYNFGNGSEKDSKWAGYMNFLVKTIDDGLLGFSPLGGNVSQGESVTMNLNAFGSGAGCPNSQIVSQAPFNLGRTVTHELGHFFNLDHVFGSCSTDDNISDTPNQDQANGGCPTLGNEQACNNSEQELFQSYMDYTDDACMFMFSAGQIARAEAYITSIQSSFKQNVVSCVNDTTPNFEIVATNSPISFCEASNNAVFNLTYTTSGDYTGTTTLSATGLPSGATASFSPSTINSNGNITLTISNLGSVANGRYTIEVVGTGTITNSTTVILSLDSTLPDAPALTSPNNNATGVSLQPTLTWSATAGTANYTVALATDSSFNNIIAQQTLSSTTFTTPQLSANTTYYWRVKASNDCGSSSNSSVYSFTTETITSSCNTYNSTQNYIWMPNSSRRPYRITSKIFISDNYSIEDINATVNIYHDWAGDLEIVLSSPSRTDVVLNSFETCDRGGRDIFATYDDEANNDVTCNNYDPVIRGTIRPAQNLSAFNNESAYGEWTLTITDFYPLRDGGQFQDFSLYICGRSSLSTNSISLEKALNIWPNPSNGTINVALDTKNNANVNVNLYDLSGRLINEASYKNTGRFYKQLNYENLAPSVYILKIENNGRMITKRVIIE